MGWILGDLILAQLIWEEDFQRSKYWKKNPRRSIWRNGNRGSYQQPLFSFFPFIPDAADKEMDGSTQNSPVIIIDSDGRTQQWGQNKIWILMRPAQSLELQSNRRHRWGSHRWRTPRITWFRESRGLSLIANGLKSIRPCWRFSREEADKGIDFEGRYF